MAELDPYRRKRDPRRTPEPFGGSKGGDSEGGGAPIFVVQRHDARRLHYDFRLERGGALASWAVPKGVPLDPGEKVLAVHVEDHPLDYATFAGEIPKGSYGAGTVEIWDTGTYELLEEKRNGQLTVRLAGRRLKGVWTLVPAHLDGKEQNWLLIRGSDGEGDANRAGADATYRPMLATPSDELPRRRGLALRGEVGRLPRVGVRARRRVPPRLAERQRPDRALRLRRKGGREGGEDAERGTRRRGLRARRARAAELLGDAARFGPARLLRLRRARGGRRARRRSAVARSAGSGCAR